MPFGILGEKVKNVVLPFSRNYFNITRADPVPSCHFERSAAGAERSEKAVPHAAEKSLKNFVNIILYKF